MPVVVVAVISRRGRGCDKPCDRPYSTADSITGDYQTTICASSAGGQSGSANFRITVLTSTLWGAVGIGVIAVALLAVFAVARFGRR
jgi:uncharacterized membrane protein